MKKHVFLQEPGQEVGGECISQTALLWLAVVINPDLRSSMGMQSFTFSLQVLLPIKENALCKKDFLLSL